MDLGISITQYIRDVKSGSITCEEFVSNTIKQIEKMDGQLHAYISRNDDALEEAREMDKKIRSGEAGILCGLPVAIKDNICATKMRTTCGSKMLEEYVSPYDATAVSRLRAQDAIIIGKTNLDEFAMGLTTEYSAFGPSKNPWNTEYVPGGSSGGSAVAVISCECAASLGSDTGGSVRNPASFCGVVGYKPTYGLVSRYGLVSYANSIEQIGPITRNVEDAAFMLNVISGVDVHDSTTIDSEDDYLENIDAGIRGKKIGIIQQMAGTDRDVCAITKNAVSKLEECGAEITEISLDMVDYSVASYYTITSTEAASNLARYDNIRYGYDKPLEGFEFNSYISQARKRFGPEVTRRIIVGGFVPSAGHAGKYYLKALKVKNRLTKEVDEAFKKVDCMISPTVPIPPFKMGEKMDDPVAMFLVDFNTVTANLTGKPAVSVPFGMAGGLPVGMQLCGRAGEDKALLQAAYALQNTAVLPEAPI